MFLNLRLVRDFTIHREQRGLGEGNLTRHETLARRGYEPRGFSRFSKRAVYYSNCTGATDRFITLSPSRMRHGRT